MSNISSTWIILGILVVLVVWIIMIYNGLVAMRQRVNQSFADIDVQLKQRSDLIPNLVETVKAAANFERSTLEAVVNARAKVAQTQIPADILTNPEAMQQFQQNQGALTAALSKLMVVVEQYPELKANQNFLTLQAQLEGTENRIGVARRDYIDAVRQYNTELKTIPGRWWAAWFYPDAKEMAQLQAEEAEAAGVPKVDFGTTSQ
jgi:LemA protein